MNNKRDQLVKIHLILILTLTLKSIYYYPGLNEIFPYDSIFCLYEKFIYHHNAIKIDKSRSRLHKLQEKMQLM